jgi:hypothetical protein
MLSEIPIDEPYPARPETIPPAPRQVAYNTRARRLRTVATLCFLLVPNAFLGWGWASGNDLRALVDHGKGTFGRVTETSISYARSGRIYHVGYTYDVDGTTYHERTTPGADEYASFVRGRTCLVTYLPEQPRTNYPGRPGPELQRRNQAAVSLAVFMAVGLGAWRVWLEVTMRREFALARDGEPFVGRVVDVGQTRGKNRMYYWAAHAFQSPSDEPVSDWHYLPRGVWDHLRAGKSITLLYDTANPRRHLPLYAFKYAFICEEQLADEVAEEPES